MKGEAAGFDTVHRKDGTSLSAEEFLRLPLLIRLQVVLDAGTRFTRQGREIDRNAAMESLMPSPGGAADNPQQ